MGFIGSGKPGLEGSDEPADELGMLRRFEPALRVDATGRHTEWLSIRVPVYRIAPTPARSPALARVSLRTVPVRGTNARHDREHIHAEQAASNWQRRAESH